VHIDKLRRRCFFSILVSLSDWKEDKKSFLSEDWRKNLAFCLMWAYFILQAVKKVDQAVRGYGGSRVRDLPMMTVFAHTGRNENLNSLHNKVSFLFQFRSSWGGNLVCCGFGGGGERLSNAVNSMLIHMFKKLLFFCSMLRRRTTSPTKASLSGLLSPVLVCVIFLSILGVS
jgi:hypothetical protein